MSNLWKILGVPRKPFGIEHAHDAWKWHNHVRTNGLLYGEGIMTIAITAVEKMFPDVSDYYKEDYANEIIEKLYEYYEKHRPSFPEPYSPDDAQRWFGHIYWKAEQEAKGIGEKYNRRSNVIEGTGLKEAGWNVMPKMRRRGTPAETFASNMKKFLRKLGINEAELEDYVPLSGKLKEVPEENLFDN